MQQHNKKLNYVQLTYTITEFKANIVSSMVGYTKAKTHYFSILQSNTVRRVSKRLENCKIMLASDSVTFSPLVIVLHANNLRMFMTNVLHF